MQLEGHADRRCADHGVIRHFLQAVVRNVRLMQTHGKSETAVELLELAGRKSVELAELPQYQIMRLNTNFWIEELEEANHVKLNLPWSVDSTTWNYYWGSYMGEIPLCFDTSASFVTHSMIRARKRRCEIVKVLGHNTNRMLYLWYFEKNEQRLETFLNCVRTSFLQ